MTVQQSNPRIENAWQNLQTWAGRWYRVTHERYFVGTLGGASQAEIYFQDATINSLQDFLAKLNARIRLTKCHQGGGDESDIGNIRDFVGLGKDENTSDSLLYTSVKIPLPGGDFECSILIERVKQATTDVRITWVPLLAFFNCADLKKRFTEIFGFFFSIQEILIAPKALFCAEYAKHPRSDASGWLEI